MYVLIEIDIANIALIDKLRLELGPGLNVLTGETGAGKSIVVGALTLVLGGRADRELIRTGTDKARVEALFDVSENPEALSLLSQWGMEAEDGLISVSREMNGAGRNVCRVLGAIVPLAQLRRLTAALVELHGQHEHQQLCDPTRHTDFLDAYGDDAHRALVRQVARRHAEYGAARREMDALQSEMAERERIRDSLQFLLGEIDAVKPKPGEMDALEKKNTLLRSAEKIAQGVGRAYELVYRGTGRGVSAQEALKRAAGAMGELAGLDERFDHLHARLDELFYAAEDVGYELQDLIDGMDFDPAETERIAGRLSELKRITRKYGPELSDVLRARDEAAARLAGLDDMDARLGALAGALDQAKGALNAACAALSQSRKVLAGALSSRVVAELSELGMSKARFEVRLNPLEPESGASLGAERAEFMLSANPGEPVKPLSSVASGGELSRIMLAMKVVAADAAGVDAMVFDEIDTGISGRMAQVVGEKMSAIARGRQVIAVTHLPQIAALGDRQYIVEKTTDGTTTGSTVRLLDRAGRVEELARMVGGAGDMQSSRAHAANLLDAAQSLVHASRAL